MCEEIGKCFEMGTFGRCDLRFVEEGWAQFGALEVQGIVGGVGATAVDERTVCWTGNGL